MILSRNWLNEFVDLKDITDKEFNDEMTLSGSKVETIERPDENLKNVVVGKILEMKRHENSDHMWVCQIDVGQAEPVQIVTGAWNIHVGDYVPAALHGAHLPGGVKIEKGKLRGVESNGMLCSLKELGMTAEHDFPYAIITPAALLNDYHPIDPAKPSIPADIKPGDKVYGPVFGKGEADIMVALERMEAVRYAEFLKPDGVAVINDYAIKSTTIASGAETYPDGCIDAMEKVFRTIAVPASEIALDLGNARCMNVVLFGAMCDSLGCPQIDWEQVVADTVPEKVRELNIRAFRAGREAAQRCR